ncbi:MAG TPA: class I SAM-dependent methyltransferase [Thermoanaerobaculia bacterium]|nr:class I SAM-dependent methyltransferase [Thermoanaerobaculia bacterium]
MPAVTALPAPPDLLARVARVEPKSIRGTLEDCLAGEASPPVTLSRLLLAMDRVEEVEALFESLLEGGEPEGDDPISEMARLLRDHRPGCELAAAVLHDHPEIDGPVVPWERNLSQYRQFFDRAVGLNEEASVAAYCLGEPALLDECTREIVELLEGWSVVGAGRRALDLGCGIGRMEAALGPCLGEIHGIDISPRMLDAARRRCSGLANVHFHLSPGSDLFDFPDASFDLVLAVDSFPYFYQGGPDFVAFTFLEIARVLRPGGDFALLNYSYRSSRAADRREVTHLAELFGFELRVAGGQPLSLWDCEAYHLRRR